MEVKGNEIRLSKQEQKDLQYPAYILIGEHYKSLQDQNEIAFDEALLHINDGWLYSRSRRRAHRNIDLSTSRAMFLAEAADLVIEQAATTIDAEWQNFDIGQPTL